VCRGYLNPSPAECADEKSGASKWIAEGPMLTIECSMMTTLRDYCRYNYFEKLAVLLQSEEMTTEVLNRQDISGKTALYYACFFSHIECVRLLLSRADIDVNIADRDGKTPLFVAITSRDNPECIRMLLAHDGIDPNKANGEGRTPLYNCCTLNCPESIRVLLSHDRIDPNIADNNGYTPLYLACIMPYVQCVQGLLSHCNTDPNKCTTRNDMTPLQCACFKPNIECVQVLLSHSRIDPNKRTKKLNMTPLQIACHRNFRNLISVLLAHGSINTNKGDSCGLTPICVAAFNRRLGVVRMILSCEPNSNGIIPLLFAIVCIRPKVVALLFNHQQGYKKYLYLLFCYCLLVAIAYYGRKCYDIFIFFHYIFTNLV